MNKTFAAAAISLGLLTSGCATRYGCTSDCAAPAETATFTARHVSAEIQSLTARSKASGMRREFVPQGNGKELRTNYNHTAYESFLKERLGTGIGANADECVKKHVIQNIIWSVEKNLEGDTDGFSLFHNTWYNARTCGGSTTFRAGEIQKYWDRSGNTLKQLGFEPR